MVDVSPAQYQAMEWRCIGPFRGARVVAVAADPSNPLVFYFGATGGGVWKSVDAGAHWENVSDAFFTTASVGAIAVAPSDPNVIYVGTGESTFQSNESHGDGMYKSTDGGRTWSHVGLRDTRHIAKIRVHPEDANLVYVAALGHVWGPNEERGVFRSRDGGESWEKVLYNTPEAGGIDISMDPNNPKRLFTSLYQLRGYPWTHQSGGPHSGLFRSEDGGDSWTEITRRPGMPDGILGKIGVAISPAMPERVWALIEAEDGGLYRSDDSGETWQKLTGQSNLWWRGTYYIHVFAHPTEADTCYVLSVELWKSTDGGRTFESQPMPHGDNHDLWIDPDNPDRMIEGSDGGAVVSLNGGRTWSTLYNQPTASFFHLTTDNRDPYHVYATQMDNTAMCVPSSTNDYAILWRHCRIAGPAESGHIAVHPDNPNVVFAGAIGSSPGGGGNLTMYDHSTGQTRMITAWPENMGMVPGKDNPYRFQFHFPTFLSPHNPDVLYIAAHVVFRSTDEGHSWTIVSPDLTTNDVSVMSELHGGPISIQVVNPFNMGSIMTLDESRLVEGLLWAGSDDGVVHVTRDGGENWENVTPPDLPSWSIVITIDPSPHDPATAYLAATRHKMNDTSPYLFRTHDYGKTWTKITDGIREDDFTRVIREDPARKGLLYSGTETGVYVSFDDGDGWQPLQMNLPHVPIHDMTVKNDDLVIATHGRAIWILDDLTPLHQIKDGVAPDADFLFAPRPARRIALPQSFPYRPGAGKNYRMVGGEITPFYENEDATGQLRHTYLAAGANPPRGVSVTYLLDGESSDEVKLAFLDSDGNLIKQFSSHSENGQKAPTEAGMNRFVWDMRYPGAEGATSMEGPIAPPGDYQVRLTVGDSTHVRPFRIYKDSRVPVSEEDLQAQFDMLIRIRDTIEETNAAVAKIREMRGGIDESTDNASGLKQALSSVEEQLITILGPNPQKPPPARLGPKLVSLSEVVASGDFPPTTQACQVFDKVSAEVRAQLERLRQITDNDAPAS